MVKSEDLFEFVKTKSSPLIRVSAEDRETEYVEPFLANEDLSAALQSVGELSQAELAYELNLKNLELNQKVLETRGVQIEAPPDFPGPVGVAN